MRKKTIRLNESDLKQIIAESINEIGWITANNAANKADWNNRWYMIESDCETLIETISEIMDGEDYSDNSFTMKFKEFPHLKKFIGYLNEIIDYCKRKECQVDNLSNYADEKITNRFGMTRGEMNKSIDYSEDNNIPYTQDQQEYINNI